MRSVIKIIIIMIFFAQFFNLNADDKSSRKMHFGLSAKSSMLTKFKDANVAIAAFILDVGKNYGVDLDVTLYDEEDKLYEDFLNKKLDTVVLDATSYFKRKDEFQALTDEKWGVSVDDEKFTQYYLIGDASKNLKGINGLKNRTLAVKGDDTLANIWINKKSFMAHKAPAKRILGNLRLEKSERRVVYDVFFGKADYAVVSKKAWEVIIGFNPSIKKKIALFESSENIFMNNIGLYSKYSSHENKESFFHEGSDLEAIRGSKKIIDILNFNYVYKMDEKALKKLEIYFDEYFELEKNIDR